MQAGYVSWELQALLLRRYQTRRTYEYTHTHTHMRARGEGDKSGVLLYARVAAKRGSERDRTSGESEVMVRKAGEACGGFGERSFHMSGQH